MADDVRHVLIVDDDPVVRLMMERSLASNGYDVRSVGSAAAAIEVLEQGFVGVIVLDVQLPDMDGPEVFPDLKELGPDNPIVFLTSHGSADLALDSIRDGAFEFLDKAAPPERLVGTVASAFASMAPAQAGAAASGLEFADVVVESPAMRAVVRSMKNAVDTRVPVLIRGESGTGKEFIARAIHSQGPRGARPFEVVNCAAIPDDLLQTELFGGPAGPGALARCNGGTLVLDEVGSMGAELQARVLRFLHDGSYQRAGSTDVQSADVRVVSASHRNLEREVEEGRFREDLYYRLAVFTIYLPPLRERRDDIPQLVQTFVKAHSDREGRDVHVVNPMAIEVLQSYSWPGNARELDNIVSYAVVASRTPVLTIADLPPHFLQAVSLERRRGRPRRAPAPSHSVAPAVPAPTPAPAPTMPPSMQSYDDVSDDEFPSLVELEHMHIAAALKRAGGNKAKAARLLGISRMTLYRKIQQLED